MHSYTICTDDTLQVKYQNVNGNYYWLAQLW